MDKAPAVSTEEDDYRFARRKAQEGAPDDALRSELRARGLDNDLVEHVLRGVRDELGASRLSWKMAGFGLAVLLAGGVLFFVEVKGALGGKSLRLTLPKILCLIGGAILARGLFRRG